MRLQLFGKIFIGFWLATVAVLASWMLTTYYFDANPGDDALEHPRQGPPHRNVLRMIYDLQTLDLPALQALVDNARREHQADIYLLDRAGADLFGRELPDAVMEVAEELRGARRRAFLRSGNTRLLAHEIYRREQGLLRAVFVFRPAPHRLLALLGDNLWLRVGLAVLVSGLVCLALSRLMTGRLQALQAASRRLATGDLDTRLQVRERGGDETDELARDFNSMAQQLQERVQAQKRLLGDVSHELRSPLARLRIALALAQQGSARLPDHLQRIEREAERLEELIGQLLASQAQGGELDSRTDLAPLLRALCTDANFEGAPLGKKVVLALGTEHAIVASTGDLLHKSLENILRNALEHTAQDSVVTVQLERHGGGYRIVMEDQGKGVPAAELDRIFDEFYRTDTARSRATGGHGLGLAIARRAVQRHGGQIHAENSGSGLRVIVSLPGDPESSSSESSSS